MAGLIDALNSAAAWWWPYVLHATWQSAVVAAVALLLIVLLRQGPSIPATVRYGLLLVVLVKFIIPPTLTTSFGLFHWIGPAVPRADAGPQPGILIAEAAAPGMSLLATAVSQPSLPDKPEPIVSPPTQARALPTDAGAGMSHWSQLSRLSWQWWLMLLHAVGVLVVLGWIVLRFVELLTTLRRCERVRKGFMYDRFQSLTKRLELSDDADLLLSPQPIAPAFVWVLRSKVILSKSLVERLSLDELDVVLARQLLHHRRNDGAANLLQWLICALWWFNPFVWLVHRELRVARRDCCDDAVIALGLSRPQEYAGLLRRIADHASARLSARMLGFAEEFRSLNDRVARLLDPSVRRVARLSPELLAALVVVGVLILPGLRPSPQVRPISVATPPPDVLQLVVLDAETGEPIADARLSVSVDGAAAELVADSGGTAELRYHAASNQRLEFTASSPGRVPMHFHFHRSGPLLEAPAKYELRLPRGVVIGGQVRSEEGAPIEGVQVSIAMPTEDSAQATAPFPLVRGHAVTTDAQGHWQMDILPPDFSTVLLRLVHGDYVSDKEYQLPLKVSLDQLRDRTAVLTMRRGWTVEGVVLDAEGNPLERVEVFAGHSRAQPALPARRTDEQGRFVFEHVPPGPLVLTVDCAGHAPEQRAMTVRDGLEPLEFRLGVPRTLRGQIMGLDGQPLTGACVRAHTWRGNHTLDRHVHTDAEGRFVFENMPPDDVRFTIAKEGYKSIEDYALAAQDHEHQLKLEPSAAVELRVAGSVLDAATGEPIAAFRIVPGHDRPGAEPPHWHVDQARQQSDGSYEYVFTGSHAAHYLRVEADGYKPVVSRAFREGDAERTFDFRLEPGEPVQGIVYDPFGAPLPGATVVLAVPSALPDFRNSRLVPRQGVSSTVTDAQGGFEFPPPSEPFLVVALHDSGYAEVPDESFRASPVVELHPWASVEGTMRICDKPAAAELALGERVHEHLKHQPHVHHYFHATTDSAGRFTFPRVAPGELWVSRQFHFADDERSHPTTTHAQLVEVHPGTTVPVQVGGAGGPVTGRLVGPPGAEINWTLSHLFIVTDGPEVEEPDQELPDGWHAMGLEERRAWREEWMASRDYQEYLRLARSIRAQTRTYAGRIQVDGAMRVEDVPPGRYKLKATVFHPTGAGYSDHQAPLGEVEHAFTIEPGHDLADLVELGTLELRPKPRVKVGDDAPPFEVASLDGESLKLADFRDKYVLLYFWAAWCDPCEAQTEQIRKVHAAWGGDERLVIMGLSLDPSPLNAQRYVAGKGLTWLQGFVGKWKQSPLRHLYDVPNIPSIWLVGPDGKVIARNLRGEAIPRAVDQALNPLPAPPPAAPTEETAPAPLAGAG